MPAEVKPQVVTEKKNDHAELDSPVLCSNEKKNSIDKHSLNYNSLSESLDNEDSEFSTDMDLHQFLF